MDNYNDKSEMENVAIANENSRKLHIERSEYNEGNVDLLANWISKINIKKSYFKREKPKKGTKHQRVEIHEIKGVVTKAKLQICNARIIEIVNKEKTLGHNKK